MKKLKNLFLELLDDQEGVAGTDNVVEFLDGDFTMSIFRPEKRLLFMPQGRAYESLPQEVVDVVYDLRQNFRISEIDDEFRGAFEVCVDPREDFEAVVEFLKNKLAPPPEGEI